MPSGFFALFDDIAVLMDDMATMSKLATKKTTGILADDLAVNAEKASGFVSARELPVLWAITKGSFLNKLIILPIGFLLSAFLPQVIVPILLIGGTYLAFEGIEKIYEYLFHKDSHKTEEKHTELSAEELVQYEKEKVKSAVMVDFILSLEIIFLALGTVQESTLTVQIFAVTIVAFLATVGVYGIVALIVRMDDMGYSLITAARNKNGFLAKLGSALVSTLPWVVKGLSIIGTFAMILVAGGIYVHNIHYVHDLLHSIPSLLGEFLAGTVVGIIAVLLFNLYKLVIKK